MRLTDFNLLADGTRDLLSSPEVYVSSDGLEVPTVLLSYEDEEGYYATLRVPAGQVERLCAAMREVLR